MSTARFVVVWCDAPDCGHEEGWSKNAAAARAMAREHGWKRLDGRDLCPSHAAQINSAPPPPKETDPK